MSKRRKKNSHKNKNVCEFCGKSFGDSLPFKCKFCGGKFCLKHRLPEAHKCLGLKEYKEKVMKGEKPWFEEKEIIKKTKRKKDLSTLPSLYDMGWRLRRINWWKILMVLVIIFILVSVWKPNLIKNNTPEIISPYIDYSVDSIYRFKEILFETFLISSNPVEKKCIVEVKDDLVDIKKKVPEGVTIKIIDYNSFNMSEMNIVDVKDYINKWSDSITRKSSINDLNSYEKEYGPHFNNNELITVVVIKAEGGYVEAPWGSGPIVNIIPVVCDRDGLMSNSKREMI